MLSNYPPGVTGNEYQISGAEIEWEEERTCPRCDLEAIMPHEFHHEFGIRAFCVNELCELSKEGFDVELPEPEYEYEGGPE